MFKYRSLFSSKSIQDSILLGDDLYQSLRVMGIGRLNIMHDVISLQYCFLRYIDSGQNPELFTRNQLKQTLEDHQAVQKKVQAYKVFKQFLERNDCMLDKSIFCRISGAS